MAYVTKQDLDKALAGLVGAIGEGLATEAAIMARTLQPMLDDLRAEVDAIRRGDPPCEARQARRAEGIRDANRRHRAAVMRDKAAERTATGKPPAPPSVEQLQRTIADLRAELAEIRNAPIPVISPWSPATYDRGALVVHAGSTWQAKASTDEAPPGDNWTCIAAGGADGRSLTIRHTWQAGEAYQRLDVVALNGASFVARQDDPGPCPGPGWQLLAAQGKRGQRA